jgi:hypothetical protein
MFALSTIGQLHSADRPPFFRSGTTRLKPYDIVRRSLNELVDSRLVAFFKQVRDLFRARSRPSCV